jgi:hypothetical protein
METSYTPSLFLTKRDACFVQIEGFARHCEAPLGAEAIQGPGRGLWIASRRQAPLAMTALRDRDTIAADQYR